jgi:hypothetical protein
MFDRFGKAKFAARVKALNNIGNPTVGKVIPSKKDQENNSRKQRRERKWEYTDW